MGRHDERLLMEVSADAVQRAGGFESWLASQSVEGVRLDPDFEPVPFDTDGTIVLTVLVDRIDRRVDLGRCDGVAQVWTDTPIAPFED
jgi:hypothetical protein